MPEPKLFFLSSVIVFVQVAAPQKALNLSAEVRRLFETQRQKTMAARSVLGREERCGGQVWIAVQLDQVRYRVERPSVSIIYYVVVFNPCTYNCPSDILLQDIGRASRS